MQVPLLTSKNIELKGNGPLHRFGTISDFDSQISEIGNIIPEKLELRLVEKY